MYITKAELETFMGITIAASADVFIDTLIEAAQDYVENYCGDGETKRVFKAPSIDTAVTRYFDVQGRISVQLPDLIDLDSVTFDSGELVEAEDFYLYPLNAVLDGKPYTRIELIQPSTSFINNTSRSGVYGSENTFGTGQKLLSITGKWRYSSTVPAAIKMAILKLTSAFLRENTNDADLRTITGESLGDYNVTYGKTSSSDKMSSIAHSLSVDTSIDQFKRKKVETTSGVIKLS